MGKIRFCYYSLHKTYSVSKRKKARHRIPCEWKTIKWAKQMDMINKLKRQRGKKVRERNIEIDLQWPSFGLCSLVPMREKQKPPY